MGPGPVGHMPNNRVIVIIIWGVITIVIYYCLPVSHQLSPGVGKASLLEQKKGWGNSSGRTNLCCMSQALLDAQCGVFTLSSFNFFFTY